MIAESAVMGRRIGFLESEVDDDDLCCLSHLLSYTDELFRLHHESCKPYLLHIDPHILQLQEKKGEGRREGGRERERDRERKRERERERNPSKSSLLRSDTSVGPHLHTQFGQT